MRWLLTLILLLAVIGVLNGEERDAEQNYKHHYFLPFTVAEQTGTPTVAHWGRNREDSGTRERLLVPEVPTVEGPTVKEVIKDAYITIYGCEITLEERAQGYKGGFCGLTASGEQVKEGIAACGYTYLLGQRVRIQGDPTGRTYLCSDRGRLRPFQVDVYFTKVTDGLSWLVEVGTIADVEVIE